MRLLLLDTTFLVDAERGGVPLEAVIGDDDDVAIAAVTLAEMLVGVRLAAGSRRAGRQAFLDDLVGTVPVIGYDETVAAEHAELLVAVRRSGRPRGAHDLIIAATARAAHRALVTADRAAFDGLPGVETVGHR